MTFRKLEDIIIWQLARSLAQDIYGLTLHEPFSRDFKLKDQINRAAGSTMDNIAEGFGRGGNREFVQFLSIARGSNEEVKSQVYRSLDRGYIDKIQCEAIIQCIQDLSVKISNTISKLQQAVHRGSKFRARGQN